MSVPSVIITTCFPMNSSAISIEDDVYKRSAVMELHINVGYVSFVV
jgi:hypothetical protein